jgi:hypothetical protein
VRKSQASVVAACWRKKARHDSRARSGAGGKPASIRALRTVVGETRTPRPLSSPTIRRYPQCGFSLARRRINAPTDGSSGGLPGFVYAGTSSDGRPAACASATMCPASPESSPTPVVAATGSTPPGTLDQLASASGEPAGEGSLARVATRESRVPSSDAVAPTNTPARTGSERRDTQTTRAINPPSTTTRAPNLPSWTPPESSGRVCEPYAILYP